MYRVRQKAHLAQSPLAESTNKIYLQKMGRKRRNKVSLVLTFLPEFVTCNSLGLVEPAIVFEQLYKSHLFSVNLSVYVFALH